MTNLLIGILCFVIGTCVGGFILATMMNSQNIGELVVVDEEGKPEPLIFLRTLPDKVAKLDNKTLVHLTVYRKSISDSQN